MSRPSQFGWLGLTYTPQLEALPHSGWASRSLGIAIGTQSSHNPPIFTHSLITYNRYSNGTSLPHPSCFIIPIPHPPSPTVPPPPRSTTTVEQQSPIPPQIHTPGTAPKPRTFDGPNIRFGIPSQPCCGARSMSWPRMCSSVGRYSCGAGRLMFDDGTRPVGWVAPPVPGVGGWCAGWDDDVGRSECIYPE